MSPLGLRSAKKKAAAAAAEPAEAPAPKAAKAAKAAKAPKAPKAPAAPAKPRAPVDKPKADIYTVMLTLSLVAVIIGCLCLYGAMSTYGFNVKAR